MKQLKRRILFLLAAEKDWIYHRQFGYYTYRFLYDSLSEYTPSSVRDACLQMSATGLLDRIVRNSRTHFRLSSQGREALLSFLSPYRMAGGQNQVLWRVAVVGCDRRNTRGSGSTATERLTVHRKLIGFGFRRYQKGVYLSPFARSAGLVEDWVRQKGYGRLLTVWEAGKLLVGDEVILARQLWCLDQIHEEYAKFITRVRELLTATRNQKTLTVQQKKHYRQCLQTLYCLLVKDPGLPRRLLPGGWLHRDALHAFWTLAKRFSTLERR